MMLMFFIATNHFEYNVTIQISVLYFYSFSLLPMRLDGKSIQAAIMQIVDDYKFDPMKVIEIVKLWIKSGFKKDFYDHRKANLEVNINAEGAVQIYKAIDVVEEIEDEDTQMTVTQATEYTKDVKIGERIYIDITPEDLELSRIAAQAAAQTIKQSLKSIEKERFYEKFQHKQGELLKGRVIKVQNDTVVMDIDSIAVVLPPEWQIPGRWYNLWEELFVLLKQITKGQGGIILDITQSTPDFVETVLRKIIPEIAEETVMIKRIVRVPGKRCKILIESEDDNIDPIGVFVGQKGDRINLAMTLLDGEKIDYVTYMGDDLQFVADCIKPARVKSIEIKGRKAIVHVNEDQKSIAIGKGAANIKLASQLSGYSIEIK